MDYNNLTNFSEDFLWGASTSAYQCEGASLLDGKTLSVADIHINPKFSDTSVASDHYHRYIEDVRLMKEMGLKAYRFSISWTRILPSGTGEVNKKGVEFYNNLINLLIENGIEPLVTIYHFDLPQELQKKYGGWLSRRVSDDFEYFCRILFQNFGDRVKYWFTINEQSNMFALPYLMVFDKSISSNMEKQKFCMNHNMTLAHAKAVNLCKQMLPLAKIGPAIGLSPCYPASSNPVDVLAAQTCADFKTYLFMDLYFKGEYKANILKYMQEKNCMPDIMPGDMELIKKATPTILGINYYQSIAVEYAPEGSTVIDINIDSDGKKETDSESVPGIYKVVNNPYLDKTLWGWEIDPTGLRILLNDIYSKYPVPIIITENGTGAMENLNNTTVDDLYRIDYFSKHLHELKLAINDGVDVKGFCPWSFMDLISTTSGFGKRYGFVYVNRTDNNLKDLKRFKKQSFYWYQKVIAENGRNL